MGRLSESERQSEVFKKSFAALCEFGHYPNFFDYVTEDENVFVRLLMEYDEIEPEMAIVVPRSEHMKQHYPALRKWFDYHGLKWKDRSRNKQRYMFAYVDKNPAKLEKLVRNIGETVFKTKNLKLDPKGAVMVFGRFAVSKHFFAYILTMFVGVWTVFIFALFELLKIFTFTAPSWQNIDAAEVRFIGVIVICAALAQLLQVYPKLRNARKRQGWIDWVALLFVIGPPVLMVFTA